MDDPLSTFWEEAGKIRMTAEEKKNSRADIMAFVSGKEMQELEAEAKAFFADAAKVSLKPDEKRMKREFMKEFVKTKLVSTRVLNRLNKRMDNKIEKMSRKARSLSGAEREEMRLQLQKFIADNPRREVVPPLEEEGMSWFSLFIQGVLPRTLALACVFLLIGSGAAYAAEDAVPGDFLYTLKVDIVERIRGNLAFGEQQKALWEGTRALRRLEEVEQLAAKDELTQDVWVRLHGSFIEHVVDAESHIDAVAENGDTETARHLSADLEAFLRAHHSVMGTINHERRDNADIREVIQTVQQGILKKTEERYVPAAVSTAQSERRKLDAQSKIMQALKAVEAQREPKKAEVEGESTADSTLRKADAMIVEANAQFTVGSYEEAAALAREAVRFAEEVKILKKLPMKLPKPKKEIKEEQSSSSLQSSQASFSSLRASSSFSSGESAASSAEAPQQSSSEKQIQIPLPDVQVDLDLKGIDVDIPQL